jgi:hypothetical protein
VRNAGGRDLLFHGVAVACGCTLGSSLPDALAPGEAASLAVQCRAPRTAGDAAREILVRSSDPARPEEHLRIPMKVAGGTSADPPALYFGYVAVGRSATRELVVAPGGGAGSTASGVVPVPGDPAVTVEPRPPRADGQHVYLIRFAPRTPGPIRTMVTLAAGDEVPVIGVGFQGLIAFPTEVMPGVTSSGAAVIMLTAGGEEPLEITGVELPPDVPGDLVSLTAGREWRLAVRSHMPRAGAGPPIRIHTSSAAQPTLDIPVRRADLP